MSHAIQTMIGTQTKTRQKSMLSYKTKKRLVPLFYVAPATFLFSLLMLFPMITVLRYSLMDGAIMKKNAAFVGLQNYVTIFEDPVFWQSVVQTLYFTLMSVIFHLLIGLAFALLLNTQRINPVIRSILRVLFILPWLFTAVIIAIIWRLLLDPNGVARSWRVASTPSNTGISMSITTASGCRRLARLSASSPFPARPATAKRPSCSRSAAITSRADASSSATRILNTHYAYPASLAANPLRRERSRGQPRGSPDPRDRR